MDEDEDEDGDKDEDEESARLPKHPAEDDKKDNRKHFLVERAAERLQNIPHWRP